MRTMGVYGDDDGSLKIWRQPLMGLSTRNRSGREQPRAYRPFGQAFEFRSISIRQMSADYQKMFTRLQEIEEVVDALIRSYMLAVYRTRAMRRM